MADEKATKETYQFVYSSINDGLRNRIASFLPSDGHVSLFVSLYQQIRLIVPEIVIRGKDGEILGVSRQFEKYLFYVVPGQDSYTIKFKSHEKMTFDPVEVVELIQLAKQEAYRLLTYPEDYVIGGKAAERVPKKDAPVKAFPPVYDDKPFCEKYGLSSEDYDKMPISTNIVSIRAYNCLVRGKIATVGELLRLSEKDLMGIRNLGNRTYGELVSVIESLANGTRLSGTTAPAQPDEEMAMDSETYVTNIDRSKALREEHRLVLLASANNEQWPEVPIDSCSAWMEELKDWAKSLIENLPKCQDRDKAIMISRAIEDKSLEEAALPYSITRERVRQLCLRTERRAATFLSRSPADAAVESLNNLVKLLRSIGNDQLPTFLHYVLVKNKTLGMLSLSVFFPQKEAEQFSHVICRAPMPVKPIPPKPPKAEKSPRVPPISLGKPCPRCGADLVVYTAGRGPWQGTRFVGCSAFPKCWYSRDLSAEELSQLEDN